MENDAPEVTTFDFTNDPEATAQIIDPNTRIETDAKGKKVTVYTFEDDYVAQYSDEQIKAAKGALERTFDFANKIPNNEK